MARVGVARQRGRAFNGPMRKTLRAPTAQSNPAGSLKVLGVALGIFYIAGYWAYII